MAFWYDGEQSRFKKTDSQGTTYYYNGAGLRIEKVVNGGQTTWYEYLSAGGEIIGQLLGRTHVQDLGLIVFERALLR